MVGSKQNPLLVCIIVALVLCLANNNVANGIFLSIDCGGSESYIDKNNIRWVGDDDYFHNGESISIAANVSPRVMTTVRAFTSLRKNCYTIPVTAGHRILVRASFYYGNFDGGVTPPIFDLYFDANYWTKVNITADDQYINNYEVIYAAKKNTTSICLAQILPKKFPFISSLEIRSLGPDMYDNGLEGPIPEFLGSLPFLKLLDLSNNRFNGTIPASLSGNKDLKLVVTGNCLSGMSCPPPPPPPSPPPPPPKVTTPPADTPLADSPLPLVPSTTPFSQISRPPPPNEFHIYSTSTSTNNKAARLVLLLMIPLLQTIILSALC